MCLRICSTLFRRCFFFPGQLNNVRKMQIDGKNIFIVCIVKATQSILNKVDSFYMHSALVDYQQQWFFGTKKSRWAIRFLAIIRCNATNRLQ